MCAPARAALLTGKNPHSVGCGWLTHSDPGFPGYRGEISRDTPTIPELLRVRGYSTLAAGKWHNTYDRNLHSSADTSGWPLQRGFDRCYGFMGAETSYHQPDRMLEGNQLAQVEAYPQGYFAPDDYTGRAIGWLAEHQSSAPGKPFFLYLAFQSPHTPHHAKPDDLASCRGRFDSGWDTLRVARYERQRAIGRIEVNAALPPRNPGVPARDTLGADQRALFARYMECYAALVDNVDQNVGRLIATLEKTGQLDNTLLMITSDNGANAIGGPTGVMNLQDRRRPISDRYAERGTFRYSGQIDAVRIEPGPQPADTPMLLDEAAIQTRLRAAAEPGRQWRSGREGPARPQVGRCKVASPRPPIAGPLRGPWVRDVLCSSPMPPAFAWSGARRSRPCRPRA